MEKVFPDKKMEVTGLENVLKLAESIAAIVREPLLILREDLKIVSANIPFYHKFKIDSSNTVGEFFYQFQDGNWDIPELRDLLEEMLPIKKQLKDFELTHKFPAIGERTFLLNATRLETGSQNEKLILLSFEDITRKKNRLKKEKQRLESFRVILDRAPAAICILRGPNHIIELANERFYQLLDNWDITGKTGREAVPEVMDQGYEKMLDEVYNTGKAYIGNEMPLTVNTGMNNEQTTYIDFICQPITDDDGDVTGIFGHAVNVTEKVQARKKIEESEKRLRTILNEVPAIIYITNEQGEIIFVNRHWNDYTGFPIEDLKKLGWLNALHPEDRGNFQKFFSQATSLRASYSESYRLQTKGGGYRWVLDKGSPKYSIDGQYEGLIGTIVDVHEEKLKEQLIKEKEHRIVSLVDKTTVAMAVYTGPEMRIELVNDAMKNIWGKADPAIGKTFLEALPELKDKPYFSLLQEVYYEGKSFSFQEEPLDLIKDNKVYSGFYDFSYKPLRNQNGEVYGVLNIGADVTEKVKARMLLAESESHFRQMADFMPAKIAHTNAEGKVVYYNQNWLDYTGVSHEELIKIGWLKFVHPEEQERVKNTWIRSAKQGTSFEEEMRMMHKSGSYKWHLTRAEAIKDENGNLKMWISTTVEIQKIKEEEKRKEDFLKMVSHELKTPVTSIKGYVQLLLKMVRGEMKLPGGSLPLEPSLERVDKQIVRLTRLISEILDLSRIEENKLELQKEIFSINELVDQTVKDIFYTNTQHRINVNHSFKSMVNADKDRIEQVLINLITNAIKYSPERENIEIEIFQVAQDKIGVSVRDRGIGIDRKDHEKIFRRFYRISDEKEDTYSGFGIGLYLANEIIHRHGGRFKVESEIGQGSNFTFILTTASEKAY